MNTNAYKVVHDNTPTETPLVLGNRAMRAGDYGTAIDYYVKALEEKPELRGMIEGNLKILRIKNKLESCPLQSHSEDKIKLDEHALNKIVHHDLFDEEWYVNEYSLTLSKTNKKEALLHYIYIGTQKNLNPSIKFNTGYYKRTNPDVTASKINPFLHYVTQGIHENRVALPVDLAMTSTDQALIDIQYIPYRKYGSKSFVVPAKIICFYLPQFHAIQENDEWWGKGFTEWTNVKPAKPKFKGHYQPHEPDYLGYYNLLDTEVQRKQVELAKNYGIGGFCFYYYWFDGKRLLEKPVENYLNDKSLDLPFCLCWANENWSRRWDGLENDILMGQNHSPEDDIAFIESLLPYLKDDRYIKIDGRPLILVYRPSLFPDPLATAERWRTWCRENDIGEIHLALTHSFEKVAPEIYGYDSAVEFPPNNTSPPKITDKISGLDESFEGAVYNWSTLVERSEHYSDPGYSLFRGVCPSWDNSARKKDKATILYGSSPREYQNWLYNAVIDSAKNWTINNRLVFVNAWNEWAEGAHLEPDTRYGFGYLEATRIALQRASISLNKHIGNYENDTLAIVIHSFFPEVLLEIIDYLSFIEMVAIKLYVTCPTEKYSQVIDILNASKFDFDCVITENRGRDVLPFFKILPNVIRGQHRTFLKLHTKKSEHRGDGDKWRNDLYEKLTNNKTVNDVCKLFKKDRFLGLVGPVDHIIPISSYWGSNENAVLKLAARIGIKQENVFELDFVAGTMFFGRTVAFNLISELIFEEDFELEAGQVDGTFAHAIERVFAVLVRSLNLQIIDTNISQNFRELVSDYSFANKV